MQKHVHGHVFVTGHVLLHLDGHVSVHVSGHVSVHLRRHVSVHLRRHVPVHVPGNNRRPRAGARDFPRVYSGESVHCKPAGGRRTHTFPHSAYACAAGCGRLPRGSAARLIAACNCPIRSLCVRACKGVRRRAATAESAMRGEYAVQGWCGPLCPPPPAAHNTARGRAQHHVVGSGYGGCSVDGSPRVSVKGGDGKQKEGERVIDVCVWTCKTVANVIEVFSIVSVPWLGIRLGNCFLMGCCL